MVGKATLLKIQRIYVLKAYLCAIGGFIYVFDR